MNTLRRIIAERGDTPMLGICLGCQAICQELNIPVLRLKKPLQGVQRETYVLGSVEHVAHYNSFAGVGFPKDVGTVRAADGSIGYIHSPENKMLGVQFHPESVMTQNGREILKKLLLKLIK